MNLLNSKTLGEEVKDGVFFENPFRNLIFISMDDLFIKFTIIISYFNFIIDMA